jgi:formylmethanofuran dehydrogenase subunit E-like metal-binding protein
MVGGGALCFGFLCGYFVRTYYLAIFPGLAGAVGVSYHIFAVSLWPLPSLKAFSI